MYTHTLICIKMLQMFTFIEYWHAQIPGCTLFSFNGQDLKVRSSEQFTASVCPWLCLNVCILTLGLLALAWGLPADAGAVLIQVEQSHQPLRSCFQLYHLCAGLHHTHTSLHCREEKKSKKKKQLLKRKHWGQRSTLLKWRKQVPGFIRVRRKRGEASHN